MEQVEFQKYLFYQVLGLPRGNGVLDSTLASCASGLGLIPAIDQKQRAIFSIPLALRWKENEARHDDTRDIAAPCSLSI